MAIMDAAGPAHPNIHSTNESPRQPYGSFMSSHTPQFVLADSQVPNDDMMLPEAASTSDWEETDIMGSTSGQRGLSDVNRRSQQERSVLTGVTGSTAVSHIVGLGTSPPPVFCSSGGVGGVGQGNCGTIPNCPASSRGTLKFSDTLLSSKLHLQQPSSTPGKIRQSPNAISNDPSLQLNETGGGQCWSRKSAAAAEQQLQVPRRDANSPCLETAPAAGQT